MFINPVNSVFAVSYLPLADFVEDRRLSGPMDEAIQSKVRQEIPKALATLPPRQEKVIRLRFGVGEKRHYTLEELGEKFSVTRERIRQIEATALRRLRSPFRGLKNRGEWLAD